MPTTSPPECQKAGVGWMRRPSRATLPLLSELPGAMPPMETMLLWLGCLERDIGFFIFPCSRRPYVVRGRGLGCGVHLQLRIAGPLKQLLPNSSKPQSGPIHIRGCGRWSQGGTKTRARKNRVSRLPTKPDKMGGASEHN